MKKKAAKQRAAPRPGVMLDIKLPAALVENLTKISAARGVDVPTMIRVAMMNFVRRARYFELDTKIGFGKYASETLETVIRCDPGYVRWARANLDHFDMAEAAIGLLDEMEKVAA